MIRYFPFVPQMQYVCFLKTLQQTMISFNDILLPLLTRIAMTRFYLQIIT